MIFNYQMSPEITNVLSTLYRSLPYKVGDLVISKGSVKGFSLKTYQQISFQKEIVGLIVSTEVNKFVKHEWFMQGGHLYMIILYDKQYYCVKKGEFQLIAKPQK